MKDELPLGNIGYFHDEDYKQEDEKEDCGPLASVDIGKCSGGSSWCQKCFVKRTVPKMKKVLDRFDWKRTRFIMLSIDPSNFETGETAYEYIKLKKQFHK